MRTGIYTYLGDTFRLKSRLHFDVFHYSNYHHQMLIEVIAHPLLLESWNYSRNEADRRKALADLLRTSTNDLLDETMNSDTINSRFRAEALIGEDCDSERLHPASREPGGVALMLVRSLSSNFIGVGCQMSHPSSLWSFFPIQERFLLVPPKHFGQSRLPTIYNWHSKNSNLVSTYLTE